jgi:hypothetical protein
MDPSSLPLGQIFGGALTLGGIGLIIRLVIHYQRDFTDQYRRALSELREEYRQNSERQAGRISELEQHITRLDARERRTQRRLLNCTQERAALRALVHHNGLPWNPADWVWDDAADDLGG